MYLSRITIENFRCFGEGTDRLELPLTSGLTSLVGENEVGKTAAIDALRFVLGTTDQERLWLEDQDFHHGETFREIRILCQFVDLNEKDERAFVEYLTHGPKGQDDSILNVVWTAKDTGEVYKGRSYRRIEVHSGIDGNGPTLAPEARELLRATYLRPLRNAEQELSAGRGSRLSQVLRNLHEIKSSGKRYDPSQEVNLEDLNVLGIGDLANELLKKQQGIKNARDKIDTRLESLSLKGDGIKSSINVSGATAAEDVRLRQLLEKLELTFDGTGSRGLGSNNLLFMACELLLLAQEDEGNKLLLIEEPEAHLHAQRQLQVIKFLQEQAKAQHIQVVVTTHSPNLASAVELNNVVMIRKGRAFPMDEGRTLLNLSDYRFLERFLDATKANLFFARGVMIVEGDAENILLPSLAKKLGSDFTKLGISIVNVGGIGLRRYARIFQRKTSEADGQLDIPVACVTDSDVMPDCAPVMIGRVGDGADWPETNKRRWRAKRDFATQELLADYRKEIDDKASGQYVRTFIADEWTLEYDLALGPKDEKGGFPGGLAEDVYIAACLADKDDGINSGKINKSDVVSEATVEFAKMKTAATKKEGCTAEEVLASHVYARFAKDGVSKSISAQYLAERLQSEERGLTICDLRRLLPGYLIDAIDYVTGTEKTVPNSGEVVLE